MPKKKKKPTVLNWKNLKRDLAKSGILDATEHAQECISAAGPITAHFNIISEAINKRAKGLIVNLQDVMIAEKAKLISGIWPFQASCKPGMEGILLSFLCHHEATGEYQSLYETYTEWTNFVRNLGSERVVQYDVALYINDNYTVGPLRAIKGHCMRMLNADFNKHYYECCVCFEKYTESTPVFQCYHTVCLSCCNLLDICPLCRSPKEIVPEYTEEIKKKMFTMLNKLTEELEKISNTDELQRFATIKALSLVDLDTDGGFA